MAAVKGDLGAIFTADDFVLPLADLGIETASTPPRMPGLKGRIENLNGVVKRWMRMRRRGAPPDGRPRGKEGNEVGGADEVAMSREDFERRVDLTLARYALHPHKNLAGETPIDCFNRLTKDDEPRMPEREHDLLVLGHRAKARVTREGVSHRGVHFRSRALDDILRRPDNEGRRYEIAAHPRHFNSIILLHPDGYWIPLYRADQPEAASLSPSVFTARKRQMAQHARNDPERNALMQSIDQETARPLRQRRSQPPAPTPITVTPTLSTPSLPAVANDDDFFDPLAEEMPCRPTARIF
jgi:hypothetical protein